MSSHDPVRAVALDFGGVVVEWNMRALFEPLFPTRPDMEDFLATVLTPAENLRCDTGTPLAVVVGELIDRHPQHRAPLEAWRDRWIETIPRAIAGTAELIDDLRALHLRVLGLSNFSAETFPWCRAAYPVFERFDDIVISGEHGIAKPDAAIYRLLCERNGLRPAEVVFFDDAPANVDGAIAAGMHASLFTDVAAARSALRGHGIAV